MDHIADNLASLRRDIASACRQSGRVEHAIRLVAVSKAQSTSAIQSAFGAGQILFGESYAQEFRAKTQTLADTPIEWHFIGHLQSNKAKFIVGQAALIHTLDRLSLATEIERLCVARNKVQDCLIEVRLASEDSKSGCPPEKLRSLLSELSNFPHIRIKGLMTIGSLTEDRTRTHMEFARLRELRDELNREGIFHEPLTELSMGMSSDWEIAVTEGATLLRIGTRIFGARE